MVLFFCPPAIKVKTIIRFQWFKSAHHDLVNKLAITLKKAVTLNQRRCLLAKYTYMSPSNLFQWSSLALQVSNVQVLFRITSSHDLTNRFSLTDKTTICSWNLLCTFASSACGTPLLPLITQQNTKRFSFLPATIISGITAMIFNIKIWELFLWLDLGGFPTWLLCTFSLLINLFPYFLGFKTTPLLGWTTRKTFTSANLGVVPPISTFLGEL